MRYAFFIMSILLFLGSPGLALAAETLPDAQLLVNQANPLPSYLEPEPLASVNAFARGNANVQLRQDAADALQAMLEGLKAAGVKDVYVNSGYRNFIRQQELHTAKIASYRRQGYNEEQATTMAARWVLPAGESEHQTGLAVDISCSTIRYQLIPAFANTPAGTWLGEHCVEYGFIIRYTEEKETITGVAPEPWHFRYVGIDHATYMREHNLCLEEYHSLLQEQGQLNITNSEGQQLIVRYSPVNNSASLPGDIVSVSLARKNSGEYIITTTQPPEPLYDTVDHWSEQQVRRLFEMQAIAGYEDGSFRPENKVSRAEFVTIMSRLPIWDAIEQRRAAEAAAAAKMQEDAASEDEDAAAEEANSKDAEVKETETVDETETVEETETAETAENTEQPLAVLPYIDADAAKYYYQPLEQCFRAALVQPMMKLDAQPNMFKPEQALLRREAALMLATLLEDDGFVLPVSPTYTDVPPAADALFNAVELLTARGVFVGDGLGFFYPEREISRAEICAMLTRLLDALEAEQTTEPATEQDTEQAAEQPTEQDAEQATEQTAEQPEKPTTE